MQEWLSWAARRPRMTLRCLPSLSTPLIADCMIAATKRVWNARCSLLHLPPVCHKWGYGKTNGQFGSSEISTLSPGVGGELPHSNSMRVLDVETHDEEGNNQVSGSSEIKSCLTIICFYQLESFSKCLSEVSLPHGNWKCDRHEILYSKWPGIATYVSIYNVGNCDWNKQQFEFKYINQQRCCLRNKQLISYCNCIRYTKHVRYNKIN